MTTGDYLTLGLIAAYVVIGVCYWGNWPKFLYFMGAAVLTVGVLLMK